jgi:hypothetical protein
LDFHYERNSTKHPKSNMSKPKIILDANKNQTLERKFITLIMSNKLKCII